METTEPRPRPLGTPAAHRPGLTASRAWPERPRPKLVANSPLLVSASKHRVFARLGISALPNGLLVAVAHEVWSLRMGTWLGVGNDPRYTPTTCFETFPLPWPPGQEPTDDPRVAAIAEAAKDLDCLRRRWLNPEGADPATLKARTLTKLHNQRPSWLAQAHARLDRAGWAAYGWDDPDPAAVEEDAILGRLLALNVERAAGR